jgi:hypothetical protein
MNQVWKKMWTECIKTNEPEVDSISEIRQNILILGSHLGFEDLEEDDLIGLLDADREPLSNEELIQYDTQQLLDEEPKPPVSQKLTAKNLSNALSYFEQGMNILLNNIPTNDAVLKCLEE